MRRRGGLSSAERRQAAPEGRSRPAERSRRPKAPYNENRSRLLGAPLSVRARRGQCFPHGLGEDRALSGVRRLRKAGRARPKGAAGRRPRTTRIALACSGRRWLCAAGEDSVSHTASERIVRSAASGGSGRPVAPGRKEPPAEGPVQRESLSLARGAAGCAPPERTVFPTRPRRGSCAQRRQAAPEGRSRPAERSRRPKAPYNENRSRLLGAPLVVRRRRGQCFPHGLGEDRALSGVRRLRKAGRARPKGAAGRRPRTTRIALACSGRRWLCAAGEDSVSHTASERIVRSAASGGSGRPVAPGRKEPPAEGPVQRESLSLARGAAERASPERTVFPTRPRRGSCAQRRQAAPEGRSRPAER